MASRALIELALAVALVATLWFGASAQTTTGCTTTLLTLAPCLTYITGNSSIPSSSCCTNLAGVVQSSPQCLCSVLNGGASNLGIAINQTAAMQLPGACNVQTSPVSQCNAVTPSSSAASPALSPTASPSEQTTTTTAAATPSESTTPSTTSSGTGSKSVPSKNGSSSDASIAKVSSHLVGSLLFLAMCASRV